MTKARARPKVPTLTGRVAKIDFNNGYGFILDESNTERFFHASMVKDGVDFEELRPGQWVSFSPLMSAKGARATMVEPMEEKEE